MIHITCSRACLGFLANAEYTSIKVGIYTLTAVIFFLNNSKNVDILGK